MRRELRPPWEEERELLIRIEAEPDPALGEDPYRRPVERHLELGVINLDKPRGPTSHEVTSRVKSLLGAERAGHGGTLDPAVSGILPILLNNATKCAGAVMGGGKEYVCVMRLHGDVSDEALHEALNLFTGEIYQVPPVRSSVARGLRKRVIYRLEFLERRGRDVLIRAACSGGTYMRKLCHDIGLYLGVGAHMQELRRTRAGPFSEEEALNLLDLYEAVKRWREEGDEEAVRKAVKPVEEAVQHLPKIYLLDSAVGAVCHGADLAVSGVSKLENTVRKGALVALMTLKGELVALGKSRMDAREILESEHGITVDIERVIMRRDLYPPIWRRGKQRTRESKV